MPLSAEPLELYLEQVAIVIAAMGVDYIVLALPDAAKRPEPLVGRICLAEHIDFDAQFPHGLPKPQNVLFDASIDIEVYWCANGDFHFLLGLVTKSITIKVSFNYRTAAIDDFNKSATVRLCDFTAVLAETSLFFTLPLRLVR